MKLPGPIKIIGIIFILICLVTIIVFHTTIGLVCNLATGTLPGHKHIVRIRSGLLEQKEFIALLRRHENNALESHTSEQNSPIVKKYIHKTSTGMLGLHMFQDYWEVWVMTSIVDNKPCTSFMIRLGMVKDTNAVEFFSKQRESAFGEWFWKNVVRFYNVLFDVGIFKPVRFNITENDHTSSVSRTRVPVDEWRSKTTKLHKDEAGDCFSIQ
jgi:hypothetical protein